MAVRPHAEGAHRQPARGGQGDDARPHAALPVRVGAWALVAATVVAGVGWLYTLRAAGLLGVGPHMRGALPLQQLAGDDGQPLGRLLAAWLPAGAFAGAALARTTALSRLPRALAIGAIAGLLLVAAGAASDAVTISESVPSHLGAQLGRPGTWVAVGLVVIGSLPASRRAS